MGLALWTHKLGSAGCHTTREGTVFSGGRHAGCYPRHQRPTPRTDLSHRDVAEAEEENGNSRVGDVTNQFGCDFADLLVVLPDDARGRIKNGFQQIINVDSVPVLTVEYNPDPKHRCFVDITTQNILESPSKSFLVVFGFLRRVWFPASCKTGACLACWFYGQVNAKPHVCLGNTVGPVLKVIPLFNHTNSIHQSARHSQTEQPRIYLLIEEDSE